MQGEVYCNDCGQQIESITSNIKQERIEDDGESVTIDFFECPNCKHRYVITVKDRTMQLMIQKRQQLKMRYQLALKRKANQYELNRILQEDQKIKEQLMERSAANKKKYS